MSREYCLSSSAETFGFLALFRVAMGGQLLVGEYSLALNYLIHQSLLRCEGEFGEGDSGGDWPAAVVAVSRAIARPRAGDGAAAFGLVPRPVCRTKVGSRPPPDLNE